MMIAAAVCPHPPLLIPEATGASGPGSLELDRLRTACREAVAALLAERPDLIVVVGGSAHTAEYPPGAPGSLHDSSVPFTVGQMRASPQDSLPLSLTIGKWLLAHAAPGEQQIAWRAIAADAPPAQCLELGAKIAALAPRVALLAMGDGPGRRARGVPGAGDSAADRYDDQVAAALAAADAAALAALDPRRDKELFVAGRAAWQVLAGAAAEGTLPPVAWTPGAFDAGLRYAAAPFEVTYFVASWRRRAPAKAH